MSGSQQQMPNMSEGFDSLPFSNQLLIWASRRWVLETHTPSNQLTLLNDAFRLARVPSALPALDGLLTILWSTSTVPIAFCGTDENSLSTDEAQLLNLVAFQQTGRRAQAATTLAAWLPPTCIRVAGQHCAALSRRLAKGKHYIRPVCGVERENHPFTCAGFGVGFGET